MMQLLCIVRSRGKLVVMIFDISMEWYKIANALDKRDCYSDLSDYLQNDSTKVCILYGLRGTGIATMMFQAMAEAGLDNIGYILCEEGDNYQKLKQKLEEYKENGKKAVFIDEITKLSNFITSSASLADHYAGTMKIVITGTDSLGLDLVAHGELYNRADKIHTTFVSYGEYSRLIKNADIDDFIHYAGVLSYEDKACDREFFNRKSASRYIDSVVSNNIANTFFKDYLPNNWIHRYDKFIGLHNRNRLVSAITAIVEMYSGVITKESIERYFKQEPYCNTDLSFVLKLLENHDTFIDRQIFTIDFQCQIAFALNERSGIDDLADDDTVFQIVQYLDNLDLITHIPIVRHNDDINAKKSGKEYQYETEEYICQPGIQYCQAKEIIDLIKNSNDISLSPGERELICTKIENDVKGQILEIAVFTEILHFLNQERYDIFKMEFVGTQNGEFDLVIYDREKKEHYCFEIKYSDKINEQQQGHLLCEAFQEVMDRNYGARKASIVLYRGESNCSLESGIFYLNVEQFLNELYRNSYGEIEAVLQKCKI